MSVTAPLPLGAHHQINDFDCGKPALNEWLVRHAFQASRVGSARTFVVPDGGKVAGYYSLSVGQVDTAEASERVKKGMGQYPIPVVILARLAVSVQYQKQGIGTGMLKDAIIRTISIGEQAGIRAMLVHPIDDAAEQFYSRFGFEPSPIRDKQLFLLMKDARKQVGLA